MGKGNKMGAPKTIGIDLGDRRSRYAILGATGEVEEEGQLQTRPEMFKQRFQRLDPSRVVIEVGTHSPWASRVLRQCGHDVTVANPRKLRLISQSDDKSDRMDAEFLARLGRSDLKLLAPVHHRKEKTQADLAVVRARDALVRARAQLVNHVRGSVKAVGGRLRSSSTSSFGRRELTRIPGVVRPALAPLLKTIGDLTEQIRAYDRQIRSLGRKLYPVTQRLQTVPGVGPITALAYVLTLEDPRRFRKSRMVGSYLGLRPRRRESGEQDPQLRITKAGSPLVRRLLVQCAQYILGPFGPDTNLRRWGLALAQRGGKNTKKRAIVAVARKLSVLLHRLWVSGKPYEPLRQAQALRHKRVPA